MTWAWKKGGSAVSGANGTGLTATFTKASAVVADSGEYSCEFTNDAGSKLTDTATVTVNASAKPPSVSEQPSDVNATAGETITLTAAATGDLPMTWQWTKDDADIAGSSGDGLSATFTKDNAEVSDSGSYKCVFSNATGNDTTNAATVTVSEAAKAPEIVTQPEDVTITEGEKLSLSASAEGTEPMDWQWKRNGSDAHNADGTGLDATLVKNVSQLAHAGVYTCEFTNQAGTTLTNEANVVINKKPVPPTISEQPNGVTVTEGEPVSLTAVSSGDTPMNWIWKKGGVEIDGSDGSGLTAVLSMVSTMDDSGDYTCTFTNSSGEATTNVATVTVNSSLDPPSISSSPLSSAVNLGEHVDFTAECSGDEPIDWQWKKDGVPISGESGGSHAAHMEITVVQEGDAGEYTCEFSNPAGSAETTSATLTIISS